MFATQEQWKSTARSGLRYVALGVSAFVLFALLMIFIPARLAYWHEFRDGARIISAVESFKNAHHRLPASLEEMNIESEYVYYCKANPDGQYLAGSAPAWVSR